MSNLNTFVPELGEKVIFGRKRGERTKGTVIKVNRVKAKVRQDESRGTMKSYPIGTVWTVPFALMEHDPSGGVPERNLVQEAIDADNAKHGERAAPSKQENPIVGATIVKVRPMTDAEMKAEYWFVAEHKRPAVIELSNGAIIYPSMDHEGNGPGVLLTASNGTSYAICTRK
jgi:hypothetical protein